MIFDDKNGAREHVWQTLKDDGIARFPFPVKGRIPNFESARQAAERLIDHPIFEGVKIIKSNPDSPQKFLRELALGRGITIYIPTPRLKGGFMRLDPSKIPKESYRDASMLSRMEKWVEAVDLDDLPQVDLIVTGCVAVTRAGKRCGKGEGYSDLEAAILQELGHSPVPVVTTVHDAQVVGDFPTDEHDLELTVVATPSEVIETGAAPRRAHLDWQKLTDEDLEEMPILKELR